MHVRNMVTANDIAAIKAIQHSLSVQAAYPLFAIQYRVLELALIPNKISCTVAEYDVSVARRVR
jgi:hypothetical protein